MDLKLINTSGKDAGSLSVNEAIFARDYNEALVHQVVNAFLANSRSGNSAQKTRAEVNKSTKKPWRQKGTGRARAGMPSSPVWRGGGRTFPNSPEQNFSQKINRKMYRAAIASIMSQMVRDERLIIADEITVSSPKTKGFVEILKNLSLTNDTVLFVVNELSEDLFLSSRNLANVLVLEPHQVDPYNLLRCNKVVFAKAAVEKLQEQLA